MNHCHECTQRIQIIETHKSLFCIVKWQSACDNSTKGPSSNVHFSFVWYVCACVSVTNRKSLPLFTIKGIRQWETTKQKNNREKLMTYYFEKLFFSVWASCWLPICIVVLFMAIVPSYALYCWWTPFDGFSLLFHFFVMLAIVHFMNFSLH